MSSFCLKSLWVKKLLMYKIGIIQALDDIISLPPTPPKALYLLKQCQKSFLLEKNQAQTFKNKFFSNTDTWLNLIRLPQTVKGPDLATLL